MEALDAQKQELVANAGERVNALEVQYEMRSVQQKFHHPELPQALSTTT